MDRQESVHGRPRGMVVAEGKSSSSSSLPADARTPIGAASAAPPHLRQDSSFTSPCRHWEDQEHDDRDQAPSCTSSAEEEASMIRSMLITESAMFFGPLLNLHLPCLLPV